VIYKRAEEMEADGFSKPYDPAKQKPFTKLMLRKFGQLVGVECRRKERGRFEGY
jgi:hypothetical protein